MPNGQIPHLAQLYRDSQASDGTGATGSIYPAPAADIHSFGVAAIEEETSCTFQMWFTYSPFLFLLGKYGSNDAWFLFSFFQRRRVQEIIQQDEYTCPV